MAYIYFNCPSCNGKLKTQDFSILGKRIKCPRCESPCPVPLSEEEKADLAGMEEELAAAKEESAVGSGAAIGETRQPPNLGDEVADEFLDNLMGDIAEEEAAESVEPTSAATEDVATVDLGDDEAAVDVVEDVDVVEEVEEVEVEEVAPAKKGAKAAKAAKKPAKEEEEEEEDPKAKGKKKKKGFRFW